GRAPGLAPKAVAARPDGLRWRFLEDGEEAVARIGARRPGELRWAGHGIAGLRIGWRSRAHSNARRFGPSIPRGGLAAQFWTGCSGGRVRPRSSKALLESLGVVAEQGECGRLHRGERRAQGR